MPIFCIGGLKNAIFLYKGVSKMPFLLEMEIFHFKYCRRLRLSFVCCCLSVIVCRFFTVHSRAQIFHTGDLVTFSRGTFFVFFSKFSNLTPPGQFSTYFFKCGAVFFYRIYFLDFWYQSSSRCPLAPVFLIFQKYAFLPP